MVVEHYQRLSLRLLTTEFIENLHSIKNVVVVFFGNFILLRRVACLVWNTEKSIDKSTEFKDQQKGEVNTT